MMFSNMELTYQLSISRRDYCVKKALEFLHKGDLYMFKFWSAAGRANEARATDCSDSEQQERLLSQIRSVHEVEPRRTA